MLVSCIANSPTSLAPHPRHTRRAFVSTSPRTACITIPLRECCTNCIHCTEECLKEGDAWREQFTRGAERLRRLSVDSPCRTKHPLQHRLCDSMPGFDAIVAVDEVDKRRGSREAERPSASRAEDPSDPNSGDEGSLSPSFSHSNLASRRPRRGRDTKTIISIENDDDLFPLPRRDTVSPPVPGLRPSTSSSSIEKHTPSQDITVNDLPLSVALLYSEPPSHDMPDHGTLSTSLSLSLPTSSLDVFMPAPSPDTPGSSPRMQSGYEHTSDDTLAHQRKRSFAQYLGPVSFLRASADLLRGASVIGGGAMPLAA